MRRDQAGRAGISPAPDEDASAPLARTTAGPLMGPLLAVQFLTVLPVSRLRIGARTAGEPSTTPEMAAALPWFPLVGALIGGLLAAVDWALAPLLSLNVRDALLLALAALLTGLLHLDGFVDCCDGLLGVRGVERRLEILRDSRVGAYGAIGAALLCLARFAAFGALGPDVRVLALVAAPLLGRWSMVYAVARFPYARVSGAGGPFRARSRHLALATLYAVALLAAAAWLTLGHALGFQLLLVGLLALLALLVTLGWTRWASQRLGGGLTGDTYGALNELVELAVLIAAPPLALVATRMIG